MKLAYRLKWQTKKSKSIGMRFDERTAYDCDTCFGGFCFL